MRVVFNEDWIHFLWTRYENNKDITEEVLKEFIYQYKDTQVTDFAMNVNGSVSTFPSKVLDNFCNKYRRKSENGITVDYTNTFAKKAYEIFEEKKLDMYKIWIDALREINIKPWISIRMNDCHGNEFKTDLRKSEFISENPSLWRVTHKTADGYFDKCLNYLKKEVRDLCLAYAEETLNRYDADGLELDFTREATCFPEGFEEAGRDVMNKLMCEIKDLAENIGRKRKHGIKIRVLVFSNPIMNYNAGLDVVTWARMGYADEVAALPRWESIDTDIPTEIWKQLLPENTKFAAGHQLLICPYNGARATMSSIDMAFAQAAANSARGADFVYLYNYMDIMESGLASVYNNSSVRNEKNLKMILKNIGNAEKMKNFPRRHTLSYYDYPNYWERVSCRLPIELGADKYFEYIRIAVGKVSEDAKVYLILGIDGNDAMSETDFEVYVNSKRVHLCKDDLLDKEICELTGYSFEIPEICGTFAVAGIKAFKDCVLKYAEILVEPQS